MTHTLRILLAYGGLAFISAIGLHAATTYANEMVQVPFTSDEQPIAGELVSQDNDGFIRTTKAYDKNFYGVVTADGESLDGVVNLYRTGTVMVACNDTSITPGDLITTSDSPGIAQKAVKSGYIIGVATAGSTSSTDFPCMVSVIVAPHFALIGSSTVTAAYNKTVGAIGDDPGMTLRYVIGALVLYSACILAVFTLGRSARAGIISLGRNPLAKKVILLSIIFNLSLSVALLAMAWRIGQLILASQAG